MSLQIAVDDQISLRFILPHHAEELAPTIVSRRATHDRTQTTRRVERQSNNASC